jgi:predicted nuclease with TOPRIM domain
MQNEELLERLASLKKELETGQACLRELEAEIAYVRETMLRISGAIQVLEELTGESTNPTTRKSPQPDNKFKTNGVRATGEAAPARSAKACASRSWWRRRRC